MRGSLGRAAVLHVLGEHHQVGVDGRLVGERRGPGDVVVDVVPRLDLDEGDAQVSAWPDGTRPIRRTDRLTVPSPRGLRSRRPCDPQRGSRASNAARGTLPRGDRT